MITQPLAQGLVLIEPGDEIDFVYFPHYGMLSLLAVLKDGRAIETATVGREGVVGAMAGLGLYRSVTEVAGKIQNAGVINYSRGVINILDRPALERMSCECYRTLLDQSAVIS